MRIALDFDGTYSEHPKLWNEFILLCHLHGVGIDIVTLREQDVDKLAIEQDLIDRGCNIIYCDGRPKHAVAKDRGLVYDIWIEDDPKAVHEGSRFSSRQLAAWRERDVHRAPTHRSSQHGHTSHR